MTEEKQNKLARIDVGQRGIEIRTFDDLQRIATAIQQSPFCPIVGKDREKNPVKMSLAGVIVGIQFCLELGLSPITGLQHIAIINGKPGVFGDAVVAICMKKKEFDLSSYKEEFLTKDGTVVGAKCTMRRLPDGNPITRVFTIADAKQAGLLVKGVWQQYTARMLQWRARHWTIRDAFPDIILGFPVLDRLTGAVIDGPDIVADVEPEPSGADQVSAAMERMKASIRGDVAEESGTEDTGGQDGAN